MSVISELIRSESDGTISFGDYTLSAKAKLDNFEHSGDLYKVKTYREPSSGDYQTGTKRYVCL